MGFREGKGILIDLGCCLEFFVIWDMLFSRFDIFWYIGDMKWNYLEFLIDFF